MKKNVLSASGIGPLLSKVRRLNTGCRGQALPLAIATLAVGALLVSPFLVDASVNLLASRHTDSAIRDYYSADAGVEWAFSKLREDPELTTNTSWDGSILEPLPPSINGGDFPTTEIRRVAGGMSNTITPAWQSSAGPVCYPFTTSEDGLVFGIVDSRASRVWLTVLPASATCSTGDPPVNGSTPYEVQFAEPAGAYKMLVQTSSPADGTVTINYPMAAYDVRSQRNDQGITARVLVSDENMTVVSWQIGSWGAD